MESLAILAALVLAYALVSQRVERLWLTPPMIFMLAGLALGRLGLLDLGVSEGPIQLLASVTLALVLFTDAIRIHLRSLWRRAAVPARMLSIGLPLAIALGGVVAYLLLEGLTWAEALLLGAILAPTDAALGQAVIDSEHVPARVRQTLNVESGLNDGLALPAVTVLAALAVTHQRFGSAADWLQPAVRQVGLGLVIGVGCGLVFGVLVDTAAQRDWVEPGFRRLTVFAIPVLAFTGAEMVGGSGFVAAFVAGLAFGGVAREHCRRITEFAKDEGQLLEASVFAIFGAAMLGPALEDLDLRITLYAVASLLVVRTLAIGTSLVGTRLKAGTVAFLGWFGPRGLASIVFTLVVIEEGVDQPLIVTVMTVTVALSTVAHGLSARPLARSYGSWVRRHRQAAEHHAVPHLPSRRGS